MGVVYTDMPHTNIPQTHLHSHKQKHISALVTDVAFTFLSQTKNQGLDDIWWLKSKQACQTALSLLTRISAE